MSSALVTINSGNGNEASGAIQLAAVAPGLFSANASGQGVAAAVALRVKADGSQSFEPVARFDQANNRFVAVPEVLMLGPRGPLLTFGDQFKHPQIIEHLVGVSRVRALTEHHDVIGMNIQRDVGEDEIVIIIGQLIIVEIGIVLAAGGGVFALVALHCCANAADRPVIFCRVHPGLLHNQLNRGRD